MSAVLVPHIGWRNTYRIAAGFGLLVAILTIFIVEPVRGKYNSAENDKDFMNVSQSIVRTEKVKKTLSMIFTNKI